jgi:uridylate kinase
MKKNWQIISLGGSLVCPEDPDFNFLKSFRDFILRWVKKGKKFVIFVGGGKVCRKYQKIAKEFGKKDSKILDEIGISATKLNATLVKSIFGKISFPEVLTDPTKKVKTNKKILIFGGYKPGWSTDFDAILMAKTLNQKLVLNLSNIDFVYDKDPNKFKDAKPIRKISFSELKKIIGRKWIPGGNFPLDPVALKLAEKEKIKVVVLNGRNFENLEKFMRNEDFLGTEILP